MSSREYAVSFFVATLILVSAQLPCNANDFDKLMDKGVSLGKREALKSVGKAITKTTTAATTSTNAGETTTKTGTSATKNAADAGTANGADADTATTKTQTKAKTKTDIIKEKVSAEAQRNARKYGTKYMQKGEGQLTKFLK